MKIKHKKFYYLKQFALLLPVAFLFKKLNKPCLTTLHSTKNSND